jgi:hypothetical protein
MGKVYPVSEIAGRIEIVQGPLGAGKTTFAAKMCRKAARFYGLGLVSNAELGGDEWALCKSWADLENYPHHAVLLDEIHLTIPSDRSLSTTAMVREAVQALTMVRKRRQYIVGTTQRWTSVSNIYKELGTRFITVRPWLPGRFHAAFDVERSELRKHVHNQKKFPLAFYNPKSAGIDTLAEVTPWWTS